MGASKKLFISRYLNDDSPIWRLKEEGFDIIHESLIEFEQITVREIPDTDWVFFYSKNAFRYFLYQAQRLGYLLEEKKIAAIGKSTADYILEAGYKVSFCGSGHGDTTVNEFTDEILSESVLFPRAKNSLNSVADNIPKWVVVKELIVYNNLERNQAVLPHVEIALLTSPMNARVFFKKYREAQYPTIIAIGRSTASEVAKYVSEPLIIADQPTEESMMEAIPKNLR